MKIRLVMFDLKKMVKVLLEILWKNVNENMFDSVLSTIVVKYDGKKL